MMICTVCRQPFTEVMGPRLRLEVINHVIDSHNEMGGKPWQSFVMGSTKDNRFLSVGKGGRHQDAPKVHSTASLALILGGKES